MKLKQDLVWVVRSEISSFHLGGKSGWDLLKGAVITASKGVSCYDDYPSPTGILPSILTVITGQESFQFSWRRGGGAFDGSGTSFQAHVWGPYSAEILKQGLYYFSGVIGPEQKRLVIYQAGMWRRMTPLDPEWSDILRSELFPAMLGNQLMTRVEDRFHLAPRVNVKEVVED